MPRDLVLCDACDGEGSLSYQFAKEAMLTCGGSRKPFSDGRPGFYYVDAEGEEILLKTIGGSCSICKGEGRVERPVLLASEVPLLREWTGIEAGILAADTRNPYYRPQEATCKAN